MTAAPEVLQPDSELADAAQGRPRGDPLGLEVTEVPDNQGCAAPDLGICPAQAGVRRKEAIHMTSSMTALRPPPTLQPPAEAGG
jgi:hypothetical protein